MKCEQCGTLMTQKTEEDLLEALENKYETFEAVPEMVKRTFEAYRWVYNCDCPLNVSKLVWYRDKRGNK